MATEQTPAHASLQFPRAVGATVAAWADLAERGYEAGGARAGVWFVATVMPGGTRAVSLKGTASVWDDEHLVFLHLNSPTSIRRKGYRFAGIGEILTSRTRYNDILAWLGRDGAPAAAAGQGRGPAHRDWRRTAHLARL